MYKKDHPILAKNYRPLNVLLTVSVIFERLIQKQITDCINQYHSHLLCGYRKGLGIQTDLLYFIEKWTFMRDNKRFTGAILMNLSKAFDTINHELLIAKLDAYGFSKQVLKLIFSYLNNRKQRVKIYKTFSSWKELLYGEAKGSVLGPIILIYI